MKKTLRSMILGSALIFAFSPTLTGCGGGDDSPEARAKQMEDEAAKHGINADVKVNDKGDAESVEIKQGNSTVGKNVRLPAHFPDDIDVPTTWNVMAVTPVPGLGGFSVQALSPDDAETILSEVRASMLDQGWSESKGDPSPLKKAGFEKDGRITNITVVPNGETNAVNFVTMNRPG